MPAGAAATSPYPHCSTDADTAASAAASGGTIFGTGHRRDPASAWRHYSQPALSTWNPLGAIQEEDDELSARQSSGKGKQEDCESLRRELSRWNSMQSRPLSHDLPEILRTLLEEAREAMGRKHLTDRSGISYSTLLNWESGAASPSLSGVLALARTLDYELTLQRRQERRREAHDDSGETRAATTIAASLVMPLPAPPSAPPEAPPQPMGQAKRRRGPPRFKRSRQPVVPALPRQIEEEVISQYLAAHGATRVPPVGDPELEQFNQQHPLRIDNRTGRRTRAGGP